MFKYLLLKAVYDLSDVDVVERSKYDMSFKYFLEMASVETVINSSSLTKFRKLRLKDMKLLDMLIARTIQTALEKNINTEPGFSTFHGYLVLGADGSGINIPTMKEPLEEFVISSRKGTKPQASIGLGCLYDFKNRMILESDCRKCKFDEMRLAEEQIDRVSGTIGISQPFLDVMDRGYPSTAAFIEMMEKDILFLARLKSSDYKKEQTD